MSYRHDSLILITARNTSSRLPGKATVDLGYGLTPVELMARRLRDVAPIVFAIPNDEPEIADAIPSWCIVSQGSTLDVLDRRAEAVMYLPARYIAILGADDCFMPPEAVEQALRMARCQGCEQINRFVSSTPHSYGATVGFPIGMNAVAVTKRMLVDAWAANDATRDEQEHQVVYWDHRGIVPNVWGRDPDDGDLRVTLDTPEDLALFRTIAMFYPRAEEIQTRQLVDFLRANPTYQVHEPHHVPAGSFVVPSKANVIVGMDRAAGDL